jgi:hypothetical protein
MGERNDNDEMYTKITRGAHDVGFVLGEGVCNVFVLSNRVMLQSSSHQILRVRLGRE